MEFAQITAIGNLAGDAEQSFTPNGNVVSKFTVASNTKRGNEERVRWFRCSLWGKQAETLTPFLKKGKLVAVSGAFDFREYTKTDGSTGSSLEINVNTLAFLSPREDGNGASNGATKKAAPPLDEADDNDDIPF